MSMGEIRRVQHVVKDKFIDAYCMACVYLLLFQFSLWVASNLPPLIFLAQGCVETASGPLLFQRRKRAIWSSATRFNCTIQIPRNEGMNLICALQMDPSIQHHVIHVVARMSHPMVQQHKYKPILKYQRIETSSQDLTSRTKRYEAGLQEHWVSFASCCQLPFST